MINKLIDKYINNLTIQDVYTFASKEGVFLTEYEANIIFLNIKENYKTLLYGDESIIFNDLKSKLNSDLYNKIVVLFTEYKNKYNKYL